MASLPGDETGKALSAPFDEVEPLMIGERLVTIGAL